MSLCLLGYYPDIFIQCIDLVNNKQILNAGLILAQRRGQWASIKTTIDQSLVYVVQTFPDNGDSICLHSNSVSYGRNVKKVMTGMSSQ